jgi:CHAT domain-containing protein
VDKLMVRSHGLAELQTVLPRQSCSRQAVVIGEPRLTDGKLPLPFARESAARVARQLKGLGASLARQYQNGATREWTLQHLRHSDLGVFVFNGHGRAGALQLAGEERLHWSDLLHVQWKQAPFLHLDCCDAGAGWGRGGGRFEGLPVVLLKAGASAVLASTHTLYDAPADFFSRQLYHHLLHRDHPQALGNALLLARRETHHEYHGDPRHWASSILWGNPEYMWCAPTE